ncbi:MAG: type II toxin-antitoxin system RnlB family antitoxin, partial [Bacteroidales bacterium]
MTNNKFKLIELSDNSMLIISTSWDAIDNYLSELTFELNGKFSNSLLVFDLLVKNGLKDRYYRSQFR